MVVALIDFEAEYDGEVVSLAAGFDWVADGHALHRRFPEKFGPGAPPSRGRRRPTGLRGGPSTAPSPAGPSVVFTEYGWEDLHREIEEECDHREGGGGLYGHIEQDGTIVVSSVNGCGLYTERGPDVIHLSRERLLRFERPGVHLIGDWHSHDDRTACPSEPDERGWVASVRSQFGVHCGMIVTPRDYDAEDWRWTNANLSAWIARSDGGLKLTSIGRSDI